MKHTRMMAACLGVVGALALPALAQDLFIYPAKGQSQQQLDRDKVECRQFAVQSTGFDPAAPTQATRPPPAQSGGSVGGSAARGALGGAAVGGIIGAITGSTKKGLAIGAGSGALLGGMRKHGQTQAEQQAQQQWQQEQAAVQSQNLSNFNRAYAACLEGRGYTVK